MANAIGKYFTEKEFATKLLEQAKADAAWANFSTNCALDYCHCSDVEEPIFTCDFDIIGYAVFGSNEGIYGELYRVSPRIRPKHLITLKTLGTSRPAYLAMQGLCGLLSYHGRALANDNLERFD